MGIEGGDGGTGGADSPISKESKSESGTLYTIYWTNRFQGSINPINLVHNLVHNLEHFGVAHYNSLPDCLMTSPASSILSSFSTLFQVLGALKVNGKMGHMVKRNKERK